MTTTTTRAAIPAPPALPERARPAALVRHSGALAWRGILKTVHSTEALLDVTLQPVIFLLLFVFVFGGAIAGDPETYLQYALPGVLVQTVVFASAGTGTGLADDLKSGFFDRFRSLPISRTAPLLGAIAADLARYLTSGVIMLAFGLLLGFRTHAGVFGVLAAHRAGDALRVRPVLGVHRTGDGGARAALGAGDRGAGDPPVDLRQQRLRPHLDAARLAAGVRRGQPGVEDRRRGAGPAHRRPVAAPTTAMLIAVAVLVGVFGPLAVALYRRRT
jgi:oleandomycin transport system permease protein